MRFVPGDRRLSIPYTTGNQPELQKGSWVMDATVGSDLSGRPIRHAFFYRVVGVLNALHDELARP